METSLCVTPPYAASDLDNTIPGFVVFAGLHNETNLPLEAPSP